MDPGEFDALYAREWPRLVGQLTVVCGSRQEAADCVQEAFVRAWEQRSRLHGDAGGWVRTAALRVAVSRWRRTRNALTAWARHERAAVPGRDSGSAWQGAGWHAMLALPAVQREAVAMHHVLDMSVADIAALVGVPEGTVKTRLARGRQSMAAALGAAGAAPAAVRTARTDAAASGAGMEVAT